MTVPPPQPSPRPPGDDEHDPLTITGVFRVVEVQRKRWGGLVIFIGVIGAGLLSVGAIAQNQTDAGMKNTNIRLQQLEQAHKNHVDEEFAARLRADKRADRQDDAAELANKKLNLVLDTMDVAKWKRPAELPPAPPLPPLTSRDGGHP